MSTTSDTGLLGITPRRYQAILYLTFLIWIGVLLLLTKGWEFQDYLFPRAIGIVTAILVLLKLLTLYQPDIVDKFPTQSTVFEQTDDTGDQDARTRAERHRDVLTMLGWTTAIPVLLYVFGYIYVPPLYLFAFVWYFVDSAKLAAAVSLIFSTVMYLLFVKLLGIVLWRGIVDLPAPGFLF